jgi:hypothetical protein
MKPHRVWCSELTHCKHGHAFDEKNTLIYDRGWKVERVCRACAANRDRACRARKRKPA